MKKSRLRAGERKSIARFREHFSGARQMTALVYRFASLIAPVAMLAAFGFAAVHGQDHASTGHNFGLIGLSTAAVTPELQKHLDKLQGDLATFITKHTEEVKLHGTASAETKTTLDKLGKDWTETSARLLAIEQKLTAPGGGAGKQAKTVGELFVESDTFKAEAKTGKVGKVQIGDIKTAIVNATGQNQPLVQDYRVPGIIMPGLRRLTVRDLLPNLPVSSNLVQYTKENVFTNAAASQTGGSPNSGENVSKAESALTFTLANAPVQTIAHWIPASRQILDDAPALAGYINARLLFGLKLEEERQLLSGAGTGNDISGLITNSTTFDTSVSDTSSDTYIDILRKAITQVQLSFFEPDGIILHPRDWEHIQLTKTTGSALNGQYIFSNPHVVEEDRIWGKKVVPTPAMAQGQFMVGAFGMAAALWDRQDATVEVSREHASFFIQNMVAILCEERIALTVFRALSLVYGGFPFGS